MAALIAGDHAGGQTTGRESAALLVSTPEGFPLDIDLRVDHSADPVADLRMLLSIQSARQQIVQARIAAGKGQFQTARELLVSGTSQAPMWPRIWTQAARVADSIAEPELAIQYLNIVFTMNPAWTQAEIGNGNYAALGADPLFHRWVSEAQQHAALSDYQQLASSNSAASEIRINLANRLLEVGKPEEALASLAGLNVSADVLLARARAYAAQGKYGEAIQQCSQGLENDPKNALLRLSYARWRAGLNAKENVR